MAEINFESLNLEEEEELNFVVEEDTNEQHDLNLCLVGRFVHDRPIRFNSMKACLADVWRPVKGMTVKEATQGLYLFKFFHPLDVEEVLKGGPWTFDNFTLIIDRLKIGVALQDIPLFHVNFWVQIYDVPIGMMLETVGKGLANYIGEFVEYDKNNNTSFWRKYMRVKVRVDVRSPLKIEKKIKLNGGKGGVVKFRDDGRRSWSNEIKAEVRRPGGRVGSRWLHEEGRNMADVDASNTSRERGSQQTGPAQTSVASPRESRGPENGGIVSTVRGHSPPLRSWQFPGLPGLMIILSWNCRGLGGPSAIPNLKKLARGHKPDVLFLSETLSHNRHIESIRVLLGFDSCLAIDVEGRSGGFAVFWKDSSNMSSIPWCIIGDFNDLLSQADKKGIHPHPNGLCMGFRQAVRDCDLTDIPIEGHQFTWIKSRGTPHVIEERLDRAMASTSWLQLFPQVRLTNLLASYSDHSLILLQCKPIIRTHINHSFRFENSWLKEPDLEDVVVEGWRGRENLEVIDRVTRCANKLQRWGKKKRIRFKEEIDECVRRMNELRGFRNFEAFNKAMVAKQVWNIVQNPNSLVAKLIKARYFPRWRIGSGDNIRVMHDPWLRGSANRWVPSPKPTGVYQLSVRDLLHDNYKAWNIVKVRNLFSRDVAEKILETPLVSSVREDKVVWDEERNECYSVKSGYKLAMRYLIGSDKYHVMGNWNGIWKAQAPHEARYYFGAYVEDVSRLVLDCWNDEWNVLSIVLNESSDTVGRVAMLLWCIWQNRNDKLWNDNVQMPRQIGRHAFDAWNDWYSVHKLQSNNVSRTTEADVVRWEKSSLDWVKCNVDVAFVSGSGRTSMGLCFRDNSGHFMSGMTQWQQTVISFVEGEAWALLLAMEEARHRGLNRVQFESDSKVLIEAIHMKRRGNSEFLSIVHDILSLMSSFINFEVKFVRRQANLVAHTLARAANSWVSFHRMLDMLLKEGLNVISSNCNKIDGRFIYTIRAELILTIRRLGINGVLGILFECAFDLQNSRYWTGQNSTDPIMSGIDYSQLQRKLTDAILSSSSLQDSSSEPGIHNMLR
ncbi:hypothetical protein TSUD_293390 [Trifolium subterraneum]|uniref:RNase H type-1 domain-containing protein n=1 Tax=Trifolium subterraneum TaxID=3900 RepID=A0A2Z6NGU7_TRISU|nr:hypothetical protein TSUD_293390 [Trifolium subterraneum]